MNTWVNIPATLISNVHVITFNKQRLIMFDNFLRYRCYSKL